jgi:adenine-specific DNA-methyltransferase
MLPSQGAASQGVYPYGLNMMERLKMESFDVVGNHVEQIAALFPNCVTERLDKDGKPVRAVDFEKLREELTGEIIEEGAERYQFTWPDKRKANQLANTPTKMTLRPCREESVDFDHTGNLYIEGDNLDVLKVIREAYLGKVKMIYIDPPYNTGNDFVYNDDFASSYEEFAESCKVYDEEGNLTFDPKANGESNGRFHTDWLNMIYPRLKVARDLLADDGVIFISIDDNEVENLKKICNDVFGEQNFVGQWNWFKSATPPNLSKKIKKNIEYILAYQKGGNTDVFTGVKKTSSSDDPITKPQNSVKILKFPIGSINAKFPDGVVQPGIYGTDKFPNELLDELIIKNGVNINEVRFANKFIWVQDTLDKQIKEGTRINLSKALVISYKKAEYNAEVPPNFIDDKVGVETTEKAGKYLDSMIGEKIFDYPKPVSLMCYLINFLIHTDESAIILDFFSGSATTAHAVMKLNAEDGGNRKFIMVQLPEVTDEKSEARKAGYHTICEIGKERIRRAGKQILDSMQTSAGGDLFSQTEKAPKLDVGFRVLKLAESNMEDVYYTPDQFEMKDLFRQADNVKPDRTGMDLLFQVMLQCGCLLSEKITVSRIGGKEVFNVADGYLIACFDKDVSEDVIAEIAQQQPVYFVMRDASAASDNVMDNFDQLFRHYSPDTLRRIL